jgi:hypothetical protein
VGSDQGHSYEGQHVQTISKGLWFVKSLYVVMPFSVFTPIKS